MCACGVRGGGGGGGGGTKPVLTLQKMRGERCSNLMGVKEWGEEKFQSYP